MSQFRMMESTLCQTGTPMMPQFQKRMVHLIVVLGSLGLVVGCSSGSRGRPFEDQHLNVFNWSNYIDTDLIKEFEEKTGAIVQYDNYASDPELETRLQTGGGGYDVIFPSDRSLPALIKRNRLAELDREQLPNWKHLDPRFLGIRQDPKNTYTAPYFWGTLAVGIRTDHVKGEVKGFEALFDSRYKGRIAMMDDAEHAVAATLLHLGLPMNSTRTEDLERAKKKLLEQRPLVQSYTNDASKEKLVKGEVWVALGWSGDLLQAQEAEKKQNIRVIVPDSGTLIWVDSMAIPKGAPNPRLAHAFVNYLLDPDVARRNAVEVRYATPNQAARAKLPADLVKDPAIYPPREVLDRCQWLEDRGQAIARIQELWREVKP